MLDVHLPNRYKWLVTLDLLVALESHHLQDEGHAAESEKLWKQFDKLFRRQMAEAPASRTLDLLAALSRHAEFSVGCYCKNEARCHRSILRSLLAERGAEIKD